MYISDKFAEQGFKDEKLYSFFKRKNIVRLDSIYLIKPLTDKGAEKHADEVVESLSNSFLFPSELKGISELEGYDVRKQRKTLEGVIKGNRRKYGRQFRLKGAADSMQYQLNEINGDMRSQQELKYRVAAEFVDNIGVIANSTEIDTAFVLVNIYVGTDYDERARQQVKDFAKIRSVPIIIYAPEGRDDKAAQQFEQIKNEWNAECGFVAGDAQWDGVLSVAETLFGFMGEPARDWLYYQLSTREAMQRFADRVNNRTKQVSFHSASK